MKIAAPLPWTFACLKKPNPNLFYPAVLTCFLPVGRCEYDLDSYKTVFHPVGHSVSYANYRQRLEVKTFAFVSGDKALPGLVGDILLLRAVSGTSCPKMNGPLILCPRYTSTAVFWSVTVFNQTPLCVWEDARGHLEASEVRVSRC